MPSQLGNLLPEYTPETMERIAGLGSLGNWMYANSLPAPLAFVAERNVSNMRPYHEQVYNTRQIYHHARALPAAGLSGEVKFFDGQVAQASNQKFLTNWAPGSGVLPKNNVFTLRALAVKIIPLLSPEVATPIYASTPTELMTTDVLAKNAATFKRIIDTTYWEFLIGDRAVTQGMGLDDLCTPNGVEIQGTHANSTATTIASTLDAQNRGATFGFELPVPIAIMPNDKIELRLTPQVAGLFFLAHGGAGAISTIIAKMYGDKAVMKN